MTRLAPAPTAAPRIERRPAPPIDPVALCTTVATAYLEVRAGRRPPDQLRPLLAHRARRHIHALVLRRRGERTAAGGASVAHVSTCWPHDRAVEVVVVLRDSRGTTAVAVRADQRRGRWWVTDVGAPEDRGAPRSSAAPPSAPGRAARTAHQESPEARTKVPPGPEEHARRIKSRDTS